MCVVCSSSSSSETVVFLKLDCGRKACVKFPLHFPTPTPLPNKRGHKLYSTGEAQGVGGASLLRSVVQLGLGLD